MQYSHIILLLYQLATHLYTFLLYELENFQLGLDHISESSFFREFDDRSGHKNLKPKKSQNMHFVITPLKQQQ